MFLYVGRCTSFKRLGAGSQVFSLLMLFLCLICIICGRVRACNCCASCPLVCCTCLPSVSCLEHYVGSVYVGVYGGLSESGLCVFRELSPVSFLVVGESPSVLS